MADTVAVTLLRHGVTAANLERRYLGWKDIPLTKIAEQDLQNTSLREAAFDFCVTSDLLRAKQTAAILTPYLEINTSPAFRELNFGDWEMKTYDDLKDKPNYRRWIDAPSAVRPPNGESFQEMAVRVSEGFMRFRQRAIQERKREILLVAHGGVIRYLLIQLTKEDKQFFEWRVPHDEAIRLIWSQEEWERGEKCTSLQVVPLTAKENG